MSRRSALALATLLTLVALVVGAPALDAPVEGMDGSGAAAGQQGPAGVQTQTGSEAGGVVLAVVLLVTAVALGYALTQYGRDDVVLAGLTTVVLTAAAVVVGARNPTVAGAFGGAGANGSVADSVGAGAPPPASLWAVGAVGSVVVAALAGVVLMRQTGTEAWLAADQGPGPEDADAADNQTALGEAAGRAADRIADDAPLDNAVYRAWREMTDALDVPNPDSSTPGEFADAAERAGMDPDDVATLTDLFESVRYGDQTPTEEREQRAERALRNIERAYGGES